MNKNSESMIKISISPRGMRPHVLAAYLGMTPFAIEELMRETGKRARREIHKE